MATARLYNLARMTTATTGTGTVTLGSAVTGFLTFAQAGVADGATVTYAIKDGNNSEIGRGVYTSSGTTLTRATILNSTNSNNALNLTGSAEVFITPAGLDYLPSVAAETGTTYTVLATDLGKLVSHSNAASIAVTLPQATGLFGVGWYYYTRNLGTGTVTITPTTSTIDGAATIALPQGSSAIIFSDGTNYQSVAVLVATNAEANAGLVTTKYVSPAQLHSSREDVASASTCDIGAAASNFVRITGTTTITSLGTVAAGVWRDVTFDSALTLTHNGTSLLIPGGANLTTAANDRMRCRSLGSGNWIVLEYTKASGQPVAGGVTLGTAQATTSGTDFDFTGIPAGVKQVDVMISEVSLSGSDGLLVQIGDSGGIETTGYVSSSVGYGPTGNGILASTSGFVVFANDASQVLSGIIRLRRIDGSHQWVFDHAGKISTAFCFFGGGSKTLSAELTQVRLTRTGSNTFDAGTVNIQYQ